MILLICPPIECWQTLSDFMRQNSCTQYLELEPKAGCRRFRFVIGPTDRTHGADSSLRGCCAQTEDRNNKVPSLSSVVIIKKVDFALPYLGQICRRYHRNRQRR